MIPIFLTIFFLDLRHPQTLHAQSLSHTHNPFRYNDILFVYSLDDLSCLYLDVSVPINNEIIPIQKSVDCLEFISSQHPIRLSTFLQPRQPFPFFTSQVCNSTVLCNTRSGFNDFRHSWYNRARSSPRRFSYEETNHFISQINMGRFKLTCLQNIFWSGCM